VKISSKSTAATCCLDLYRSSLSTPACVYFETESIWVYSELPERPELLPESPEVLPEMIFYFSTLFFFISIPWRDTFLDVECSKVNDEFHGKPNGDRYCVDLAREESTCSSDPVEALKLVYSMRRLSEFDAGVAQTIDGTDAEKKNIRDVLSAMNQYWYDEILSNFEYDVVRSSW
jgi:hypothetical protein